MKKTSQRTPKNYNGTAVTSHSVKDLLPSVLTRIGAHYQERPDLVLAAWPSVIGPQLASMTQAMSLVNGVMTVKVKNSTLHSLLSRNDKFRLLNSLQQRFPKVGITDIIFRIG